MFPFLRLANSLQQRYQQTSFQAFFFQSFTFNERSYMTGHDDPPVARICRFACFKCRVFQASRGNCSSSLVRVENGKRTILANVRTLLWKALEFSKNGTYKTLLTIENFLNTHVCNQTHTYQSFFKTKVAKHCFTFQIVLTTSPSNTSAP